VNQFGQALFAFIRATLFFRQMYASAARSFQSPDYQYNPNNSPWQKLLWVKQNYPDNYVDSTFLDELQRNGIFFMNFYFPSLKLIVSKSMYELMIIGQWCMNLE
jgi:hypothetical protein